ncbi:MAG: DUF883 domain-containing protein [Betaproteobacteria bacterium]|nr:DUF883 domain-containing protein [Betaproteobacteria bacterium]
MSEASKQQLLNDFNAVVADTEQLMKSLANEGGERAQALRTRLEQTVRNAKDKLIDIEEAVVIKTKAAARATDDYVQDNPWKSVGIAAAIGVVIGIALGLLLNRR